MIFQVIKEDKNTKARVGRLQTRSGTIQTPVFLPVGTKGAVKTIWYHQLLEMGTQIILFNTYHLYLRPGREIIKKCGGLQKFTGWHKPILTDSGGYQIFSLSKLTRISENGVEFQSHIDGTPVFFTPESVILAQKDFDSDIVMPLDYPVGYPSEKSVTKRAMELTHLWLKQTRDVKLNDKQTLFGIIQGGFYKDLRRESADKILSFNTEGVAIGGLSINEPNELTFEITDYVMDLLPRDVPVYLMGVGTPYDIVRAVALGVDMFDCILPTRFGRTGWAFTSEGMLKIKHKKFKDDPSPLDKNCTCPACKNYSRCYIKHLFNIDEILGLSLISYHNVYFYLNLMKKIRESIIKGTFDEVVRDASRCQQVI
jgi:queuine tRNA-ribosyltransferase